MLRMNGAPGLATRSARDQSAFCRTTPGCMMAGHFMRGKIAITRRRSIALFALLSIAMVIFSYVLVIFLAAACVYLPYLVITNVEHPNLQIVILFLGGIAVA